METKTPQRDVYAIVTNRIINLLEKGTIPWKQPWTNAGAPKNLVSGKQYKGINIMLLASLNYAQNLFLTEKQLNDIGATTLKDEKPHIVVFWNWNNQDNKSTETNQESEQVKENKRKEKPVLRYYRVLNVSQCSGIPKRMIPDILVPNDPIGACEAIVVGMPNRPEIIHDNLKAYYDRVEDLINIPELSHFESSEEYYNTLYHELMHSSGHSARLNRKEVVQNTSFGTLEYSLEELTAEIGACFLASLTGIAEKVEYNSASYIKGWLKVLKNDRKFIFFASSNAQKGVYYILNTAKKEEDSTDDPQEWLQNYTKNNKQEKAIK